MPKVNGLEVLKYLHNNRIPAEFCFLTCYEEFEYAKAALRYGASNYITKPFDMGELQSEIQRMVLSVKTTRSAPESAGQTRPDSVLNNVLRQRSDGVAVSTVQSV